MKIVRRLHMYTGLLLLPWILLFGFSGMLFNHPEWGAVDVLATTNGHQTQKLTGFEALDSRALAEEVVESLNEAARSIGREGDAYALVQPGSAKVSGQLTYSTTTDQGRAMVVLSANTGEASVRRFPESKSQDQPVFQGSKVAQDLVDMEAINRQAEKLLRETGLEPQAPLALSGRGGPELRFQVVSKEDGRKWNATYSLTDGSLAGRATDDSPGMNAYSLLTRLHKTHHYPDTMGARWLWTLAADTTGLTMVFWALTGLAMWWQMKPTRVLGVTAISVAAVIGFVIFSGTLNEMTFGPTSPRAGGGGGSPSTERSESSRSKPSEDRNRPAPEES